MEETNIFDLVLARQPDTLTGIYCVNSRFATISINIENTKLSAHCSNTHTQQQTQSTQRSACGKQAQILEHGTV